MNLEVKNSNYRNDAILLGFSDLKRLKTERPLVFERGKGIFIFDENGKDYIESVSCFYCVSLGFSEERLIEAATRQMRALPMYSSAIHRTVPAVMELTERLAALSPVKNPRIYFSTTGSEANDHLMKFMWYGNGFAGEPQRRKMISRRASYQRSAVPRNCTKVSGYRWAFRCKSAIRAGQMRRCRARTRRPSPADSRRNWSRRLSRRGQKPSAR